MLQLQGLGKVLKYYTKNEESVQNFVSGTDSPRTLVYLILLSQICVKYYRLMNLYFKALLCPI